MPYTHSTPSLPFSGSTPTARECSRRAAEAKAPTLGRRTRAYLAWLAQVGTATDAGAAECVPLPLQSVCSTRNAAMARGLVEACGDAMGRYGLRVTCYRLTALGRMAVDDAGLCSPGFMLALMAITLGLIGLTWTVDGWLVYAGLAVLGLLAVACLLRALCLAAGEADLHVEDEASQVTAWERACEELHRRRRP